MKTDHRYTIYARVTIAFSNSNGAIEIEAKYTQSTNQPDDQTAASQCVCMAKECAWSRLKNSSFEGVGDVSIQIVGDVWRDRIPDGAGLTGGALLGTVKTEIMISSGGWHWVTPETEARQCPSV